MKTSWNTLVKECPYSTVKKGERERERALRIMNAQAVPKMSPLMKMSRSCSPWLCVIGGETFAA